MAAEPQFCLFPFNFLLSAFAPLHLSRVLYKSTLFMQNKPNFRKAEMNISPVKTMNYEQLTINYANKNKPNQTQYKANTNPISTKKIAGLKPNYRYNA